MHRAVHGCRLAADVLHDVDLASLWPADDVDVRSEHPERGPHALTARDLDACFELAIRAREQSRRADPSRRVETAPVPAIACIGRRRRTCGDHQVTRTVEHGVVVIGVELALLVAKAVAAELG